jgi:toluene monooxygenase electron transfer component
MRWTGATGFVHERVREFVGDRWAKFDYYFAGPPPMVEAVQRMLIERRVPFPQVHFDRFY